MRLTAKNFRAAAMVSLARHERRFGPAGIAAVECFIELAAGDMEAVAAAAAAGDSKAALGLPVVDGAMELTSASWRLVADAALAAHARSFTAAELEAIRGFIGLTVPTVGIAAAVMQAGKAQRGRP